MDSIMVYTRFALFPISYHIFKNIETRIQFFEFIKTKRVAMTTELY